MKGKSMISAGVRDFDKEDGYESMSRSEGDIVVLKTFETTNESVG